MKFKEYELPDGRKAVFEYDSNGVGKITLECLDTLMGMIADRPQGEWMSKCGNKVCACSNCGEDYDHTYEWIEEWNSARTAEQG